MERKPREEDGPYHDDAESCSGPTRQDSQNKRQAAQRLDDGEKLQNIKADSQLAAYVRGTAGIIVSALRFSSKNYAVTPKDRQTFITVANEIATLTGLNESEESGKV